MAERIGRTLARTSALFIHAVTASISRTHSQCQRGARKLHIRGRSRETVFFIPGDGGASRDRTDDLKLAKLALSQLSYGPLGLSLSDGGPSRS
jgi:hypothetical protein